jgi:SAM-dependent methyltransferase
VVALAQRGYDCTGYDFTPARIEAAKARAIRAAVSVELKQGDATRLRTRDRFDGVLALYILFLLPNDDDVKRCLSSIHSLLFPGGVLICSIYNPFSSAKNWVTETTRQGVFVEESKAPGIRTVTITRLRQFDRMRGVCWMNETEIIDAPDGVHLFHDQERVRLFTYSEILNLLRTTVFRDITAHLDWKRKPVENSKAEEIVFVARK